MSCGSRRGSLTHTNSRVLILTTIILYASTATYVAALMWNRSQAHHLVLGATNRGLSPSYDGYQDIAAFEDAVRKQSWMAAVALEVNVRATVAIPLLHSFSTVIVHHRRCHRVVARVRHLAEQGRELHRAAPRHPYIKYVLYPPARSHITIRRNRLVVVTDVPTVISSIGYHEPQIVPTTGVALLDTDNVFVKAAVIVTLATNALSTALIAYKAWYVPLPASSVSHTY